MFPTLERFARTELGQDWDMNGANIEEITGFYVRGAPAKARELGDDAAALLSAGLSEAELDTLFAHRWGCGFEPDEDRDETWTGILARIVATARAAQSPAGTEGPRRAD